MNKNSFTPGVWKAEIVGTMSGRWISIYVDDPAWDGGKRELFQSETFETSEDGETWTRKPEANQILSNARMVACCGILYRALEQAWALLSKIRPNDMPFPFPTYIFTALTKAEGLKINPIQKE